MFSSCPRWSPVIAGVLCAVAGVSFVAAGPACPPTLAPPTQDEIHAAVRDARDHGALWTIEKDGHGSWLYGTMHVGNLAMSTPGPKLIRALAAADVLAIEVDVTNPVIAQAIRAPRDSSEGPAVPPALLERLKALAEKACVPWEPLSKLPPMLTVAALTALEARWDGLDPSYGTELVLAGFAQARKMPIVSLESPGVQRKALSGGPPSGQLAALERVTAALEQGHVRPAVRALARAWQDGDLVTIADYEQWSGPGSGAEAKADVERIVFGRNPDLAAAIDLAHREGKRVFAATGILHMVGDGGLPRLLQKLGYKVERVRFEGESGERKDPDPAPR
jgi:uncharacterized protein YbaP (TraB family)